jgi:hypothetical protein
VDSERVESACHEEGCVIGEAYGTYGGGEKCIQNFVWKKKKEIGHLNDLGVDGSIILRVI